MARKIKLIWDFRGPDALQIATHHCVHLQEFANAEKGTFYEIDSYKHSDLHSTAYIIIDEKDMLSYRDTLKPHRGEVAN